MSKRLVKIDISVFCTKSRWKLAQIPQWQYSPSSATTAHRAAWSLFQTACKIWLTAHSKQVNRSKIIGPMQCTVVNIILANVGLPYDEDDTHWVHYVCLLCYMHYFVLQILCIGHTISWIQLASEKYLEDIISICHTSLMALILL